MIDFAIMSYINKIEKKFFFQILSFSLIGILNSAITLFIIFFLYNLIHLHYLIANLIGYIIGLISSFILNKKYTFKSKENSTKEILLFFILFGMSYLLNLCTVMFLMELINVDNTLSQIAGMLMYTVTNFLGNKYWTFKINSK
jgi:putative flippase GtrA